VLVLVITILALAVSESVWKYRQTIQNLYTDPHGLAQADFSKDTCRCCSEFDFARLLSGHRIGQALSLGSVQELEERTSCTFCQFVYSTACQHVNGLAMKWIPPRTTVCSVRAEIAQNSDGQAQIAFTIECGGIFLGSFRLKTITIVEVRPWRDEVIHFDILRKWLDICATAHPACRPPVDVAHTRSYCDILLIDIVHMRLVQADTSYRYIALSYVNGQATMLKASKENISHLQQDGALNNLDGIATVVLDAIEVVKQLKERYLWVDAPCIIQDDQLHKHHQISQMDRYIALRCLPLLLFLVHRPIHRCQESVPRPATQYGATGSYDAV
jgi:hypothetical protein